MAFDPYWEWLQIPPDRRPPDFYALLNLTRFEPDAEKIRSAGLARTACVRRFCLGQHGAEATQLLGELAEAFACLQEPSRKQAYDESLRTRSAAAAGEDSVRARQTPRATPVSRRPTSEDPVAVETLTNSAQPPRLADEQRAKPQRPWRPGKRNLPPSERSKRPRPERDERPKPKPRPNSGA